MVEEIEEGPVTGEADADDSCGDHDFRGDFDQAASPSAGLAFAERIVCAAAVVIAFAFASSQCFDGQFGGRMVRSQRFGLRWLSDVLSQADQQIGTPGMAYDLWGVSPLYENEGLRGSGYQL